MKPLRRAERGKDAEWALSVFDKAPYATLSMIRPDGSPYGVPLSIVRKDSDTFYFHCAPEGEKIDCINYNSLVFISAVTRCKPVFEEGTQNFTTHYRSAMAMGKAELVTDEKEKTEALRLLCQRFLPQYMEKFDEAVARSLHLTAIYRITLIEPPVGKEKTSEPKCCKNE